MAVGGLVVQRVGTVASSEDASPSSSISIYYLSPHLHFQLVTWTKQSSRIHRRQQYLYFVDDSLVDHCEIHFIHHCSLFQIKIY